MRQTKYVTFELENEYGISHIAVVFSEHIVHKSQAQSVIQSQRKIGNNIRIHGAGFLAFKKGQPCCHGYSESLGLGADPEDSEIVRAMLNGEIPILVTTSQSGGKDEYKLR